MKKQVSFRREIFLPVLADILSFSVAAALSISLRMTMSFIFENDFSFKNLEYSIFYSFYFLATFIIFLFFGLYPVIYTPPIVETKKITIALFLVFGITYLSLAFLRLDQIFSRIILVGDLFFSLAIYPLGRTLARKIKPKNSNKLPAIILTSNNSVSRAIKMMTNENSIGVIPKVLMIIDKIDSMEDQIGNIKIENYDEYVLGSYRDEGYSTLCVFLEEEIYVHKNCFSVFDMFPNIYIILPSLGVGSLWVETSEVSNRLLLHKKYSLLDSNHLLLKSMIDRVIGFMLLILLSPILVFISILLVVENQGGVIYSQSRIGQDGKTIKIYKFRSMIKNAESILKNHLNENLDLQEEYEKYRKLANDPRVTRLGKILRKFSIDELPQLYNVLMGELSLVGPRAYLLSEYESIKTNYRVITKVKPGLTGWWQINGRNEKTFQQRQNFDLYYIQNWSLWLDYYILLKSIWTVISGSGR